MSADADPHPAAGSNVIDDALTLLRARGGRATSARRLLLEAPAAAPGHHTADELATQVQARRQKGQYASLVGLEKTLAFKGRPSRRRPYRPICAPQLPARTGGCGPGSRRGSARRRQAARRHR